MKRHSTDPTSLLFGLIFLGIAAWWLADPHLPDRTPHLGWIAAAALIVFGLLGVIGSSRRDQAHSRTDDAPAVGPNGDRSGRPDPSA